jgi:hypothetical protein
MQVAQYTFQSPYSSPIQVGRLDPSSLQDDSASKSSQTFNAPNETEQKAQDFSRSEQENATPSVTQNRLDIYA